MEPRIKATVFINIIGIFANIDIFANIGICHKIYITINIMINIYKYKLKLPSYFNTQRPLLITDGVAGFSTVPTSLLPMSYSNSGFIFSSIT